MRTYTHDQVDAMSLAEFARYCDEIERDDEEWHLRRHEEAIAADWRSRADLLRAEAGDMRRAR